jgi:O-antigen ligase
MIARLHRAALDVFFISAMAMCLAILAGFGTAASLAGIAALSALPLLLGLTMVRLLREERERSGEFNTHPD